MEDKVISDVELRTILNSGDIIDSDVSIIDEEVFSPAKPAKDGVPAKRGTLNILKRLDTTFDLDGETLSLTAVIKEVWFYQDGEDAKDATCDLKNLYKQKVKTIRMGYSGQKLNWSQGGDVEYIDETPESFGKILASEVKSILKELS